MKLYVGNLAFQTTTNDLREAFERFGTVTDVQVMVDQATNRSRGFGFVTMGSVNDARAAINALNGQALGGRNVNVSEARPREDRRVGSRGGRD